MQDAGYVKKAFAGIARRYMLANHVLSLGIDVLWRKKTGRLISETDPKLILDIATGSGDLAREIQEQCPAARVLGADFSIPMMREAQSHGSKYLVAADGTCLPFQNGAFDVLTVAFGLRNMASWPGALQEMSRVLKSGGHLFVLDFSLPTLPIIRPLYLFYLKRVMPRIAGWITGERAAYEYLCSSVEKFPSGSAMEELIRQAGFSEVQSHRLTLGIASLYIGCKGSLK
jgi:demethylmenaquinone methyltransferase/2-methoxy-6-polyprenyl-1,4-benzoquinol methylase